MRHFIGNSMMRRKLGLLVLAASMLAGTGSAFAAERNQNEYAQQQEHNQMRYPVTREGRNSRTKVMKVRFNRKDDRGQLDRSRDRR